MTCHRTFTVRDWQGFVYSVEIAFVRFIGGWIVWVDDEPMNDDAPFASCADAERFMLRDFGK